MSYIKSNEFVELVYEAEFNLTRIAELLTERYPSYDVRPERIRNRIANYRRKGLLPLDSGNSISLGEQLKSTSTLYDSLGNVKMQWVKSDVPKQVQLDAFESAIAAIVDRVPSTFTAPPLSTTATEELLTIYPIGDAHIGMLAWGPETGTDNDLSIIEHSLTTAMNLLVEQATPSAEAFIIDVGDWFHSDNEQNRTKSGNALDVDGRYAKVLEVGLMLATKLIEAALMKHSIVHWRSAIGNHNDHSAIMMNQFIKAYYRNEPRVVVHCSPAMFYYYQFGKNLLGITHGHTAKADRLGEIMAVDQEDIWSSTKFRYWYTGHVHHQSVKEYPSCVVETFRTLASKDAWHTAMGYRSGQDMKCITLHKDYGEISRNVVNLLQFT